MEWETTDTRDEDSGMPGEFDAIDGAGEIPDDGGRQLLTVQEAYDVFADEMAREGNVDYSGLAHWTSSTSKSTYGISKLVDGNYQTWWQSDGNLPHVIDVRFARRVRLNHVAIFCDYVEDESYTPRSITLYCGSGPHDLVRVHRYTLDRPEGWSCLLLDRAPHSKYGSLPCFFVRIEVNANHQNGKDSRVREIRLLGPRQKLRPPL